MRSTIVNNHFSKLILLGFILTAGGIVSAANASNPCTKPVPYKGWQKNQFDAWKKLGIHRWGINTIMLGDSITALWRFDPKWADGSKTMKAFKKEAKGMNIYNFAIPGDEPQNVLYQITDGELLKGFYPKMFTLMIGINSLNRKKTPEQVAEGIKKILDTLQSKFPKAKILLMAIWPCWGANHPVRAKITKTNDIIKTYADGKQIFYLDLGNQFTDQNGKLNKALVRDGIHLSEKGYEVWGKAMFPYMKDIFFNNGQGDIWQKQPAPSAVKN